MTVATADFDEDGHADLAMTNTGTQYPNYSHGTVSILLGDGDGSFQSLITYTVTVGNMLGEITCGDFDEDGHTDLAVACGDDTVAVLLGNGDGTLRSPVKYAAGDAGIVTGDFDNDGHTDLAVSGGVRTNGYSYFVWILLGNGDGTFQSAVNYAVGESPLGMSAADLDGDGDADLAVANGYGAGTVSVLLGNGDGTFQSAVSYPAGTGAFFIASADLNGDGDTDLAVTNWFFGSTLSVLLGNGDGTFQSAVSYTVGEWPFGISAADLDGDGDKDLAVANMGALGSYDSRTVSILLGNGDGTFASAVNYCTAGDGPAGMVTGDFVEDGHIDLAVACHADKSVSILIGNGDGTFGPPSYPVGDFPIGIAEADFDKDGNSDLAVANYGNDNVSVLLGKGDGSFETAVNCAAGTGPTALTPGDFDEDGDTDLAVSNLPSYTLSILIGNGDGTFQNAVSYSAGSGPAGIASADFNEDGHSDLAAANHAGGTTVSVVLGNGDGSFQSPVSYAVGDRPTIVTTGDFDEDGHIDLAVSNNDSENVSILLGDGDGTFETAVNYAVGSSPDHITTGDFDEDGHTDLAVAERDVSILLGNGDGTFQTAVIYEADRASGVTAGDFDDDGHTDVAVSGQFWASDAIVSILLGNGDGSFHSGARYTVGDTPGSEPLQPPWLMVSGDFDKDGNSDLAVPNQLSGNVAILLSALPRDSDSDGMPDEWELTYGFNPDDDSDATGDLDGDGLTNLEEYTNEATPNDGDSDDDGVSDGDEVNMHGTDPRHADSDRDGVDDSTELFTDGTDPTRPENVLIQNATGGVADNHSGTRVEFPSGCLSSESIVADISVPGSAPVGVVPEGLDLTEVLFSLEPDGETFDPPVTVTIVYAEGDLNGVDEETLTPVYWTGTEYSSDGLTLVSLDTDTNTLIFTTTHFSIFVLAGEEALVPAFSLFGIATVCLGLFTGAAIAQKRRENRVDPDPPADGTVRGRILGRRPL